MGGGLGILREGFAYVLMHAFRRLGTQGEPSHIQRRTSLPSHVHSIGRPPFRMNFGRLLVSASTALAPKLTGYCTV